MTGGELRRKLFTMLLGWSSEEHERVSLVGSREEKAANVEMMAAEAELWSVEDLFAAIKILESAQRMLAETLAGKIFEHGIGGDNARVN